ncbi:MAG: primase-helicase zinc-binding domain-containing protein, partial [Gammaproteobacteria bacterium]
MLNLETSKHTFDRVKRQARNRWSEILAYAGVDAKALHDVHGPCPGCKGKDRFRFDNKGGDGTFICSQGNGDILSGDGFE